MDLRELRYLVAVAEAGHVGRAAERLFISQPSLSYALRKLERELGVVLLERHARGVTLTEAGRDVVAEARRALRAADRVQAAAERHAAGIAGRLRIGFQASGAGPLATRIRSAFEAAHPGVVVEPRRYDWGGEVPALRDGEVDVAFVWLPNDVSGLATMPLTSELRIIGLPADHRLASRSELSIMDVKDEPLVWTRKAPRPWVEWWAVDPRPDGSHPKWGAENDNIDELLDQVAAGHGASIGPRSHALYYSRPDIVWVPLVDVEPLRIELAWDPDSSNPAVAAYVAIARKVKQ
jgi:DNA-binding transcriptional LysR family regulator